MSNCITREYLMQNVAACTPVEYEVPEWGGHVFIERTMTEKAAEYANTAITDMSDNANKMGTSMESIQNAYQGFAKQNYTINLMSAA